jgi:hypothetical protein
MDGNSGIEGKTIQIPTNQTEGKDCLHICLVQMSQLIVSRCDLVSLLVDENANSKDEYFLIGDN